MLKRLTSLSRPLAFLTVATVLALVSFGSATPAQAQSNYPVASTIIITDQNGNVVTGSTEVAVGQKLTVTSNGWMPNSDVSLSFVCGSAQPVALGTFKADGAGVVHEDFIVPGGSAGNCALRLSGLGSDGNARTVEAPILVKGSASAANANPSGASATPSAAQAAGATRGAGPNVAAAPFAKTGSDVWRLAALGFALLAIGAVLVMAVRRGRGTHTLA